jgi:hypothetical protein
MVSLYQISHENKENKTQPKNTKQTNVKQTCISRYPWIVGNILQKPTMSKYLCFITFHFENLEYLTAQFPCDLLNYSKDYKIILAIIIIIPPLLSLFVPLKSLGLGGH